MMNSQEMKTAVQLDLDLVVVVLCDSGYGMIKWKQENMGFKDFGLDFENPDFVKYAAAYGAFGQRVESADQFKTVVEKALEDGGVHLIEVPVDYSDNDRILNHELGELSEKL